MTRADDLARAADARIAALADGTQAGTDIGDVNPLNTSGARVNPATAEGVAAVAAKLPGVAAPNTPLGNKTANSATWDNDSGELSIPANTIELHVYCEGRMYLVVDSSTNDPSAAGAIYAGGITHRLPVSGQTKLHYKNAESSDVQKIYATALVAG
jgi:hypothetical protein